MTSVVEIIKKAYEAKRALEQEVSGLEQLAFEAASEVQKAYNTIKAQDEEIVDLQKRLLNRMGIKSVEGGD